MTDATDKAVEAAAKALADCAGEPFDEISRAKYLGDARAALTAASAHTGERRYQEGYVNGARHQREMDASAHTGERMARAIEALLPEIEEAEIGHGGGSHDDECPTCAAIKEAGAALAAYRSAPRARHQYDAKLGEITDQDREYAADLMDDLELKPGSEEQRNEIALWFRKVRYEAVMKDREPLSAPRAPEAVGGEVEGWKMVPVEPTEEMCRAGSQDHEHMATTWGPTIRMFHAFQAMLAASPPPPDGWRGIESAPRDGSAIELWLRKPVDRHYMVKGLCDHLAIGLWLHGRWGSIEIQDCGSMGGEETGWMDDWCHIDLDPTHWRPLPSPPGEELGKG